MLNTASTGGEIKKGEVEKRHKSKEKEIAA
jgi:hypothetical protein